MEVNNVGQNDSNNMGWILAIVLILLVLIGGYFAFARTAAPVDTTGTNNTTDTTGGMDDSTVGGDVSGSLNGSGSATIDTDSSGGSGSGAPADTGPAPQ